MTSWMRPRLSRKRAYSGVPSSASMTSPQLRRSSIVSNSGTMSRSSVPSRGCSRPASFSSTRDFEHVGDVGRHRDHVMRHRGRAVAAMRLGGGAHDRQLARGLVRIGHERRGERPRRGEFRQQQADALVFAQREVVGARLRRFEQFADDALVHVRVLAQVDRREMKAEHIDGAAQIAAAGPWPAAPSRWRPANWRRSSDRPAVRRCRHRAAALPTGACSGSPWSSARAVAASRA